MRKAFIICWWWFAAVGMANPLCAQYYFDSTYIKKYYNQSVWSLYQNYNNHSLFISQRYTPDTASESRLQAMAESLANVGFSYADEKRVIAFNLYSVPYQPSERKPPSRAINIVLSQISGPSVVEMGANWFSGYFEQNSENVLPGFSDSTAFYRYEGSHTLNTFLNFMHFSNHRKFSYGAAYRGNSLQKKSASSFVSYTAFNHNNLRADSVFIPPAVRNRYDRFAQLNKLSNTYFSMGIGYSGTLVIAKVFFANLTLMAGPGLQYQRLGFADAESDSGNLNLLLHGDLRTSIGFNFPHFYILSASVISFRSYNMDRMSLTSGHLLNQFTIGLRLNRRGKIF